MEGPYDIAAALKGMPSGADLSNDYWGAYQNAQNAQIKGMEIQQQQRAVALQGQYIRALQSGDTNTANALALARADPSTAATLQFKAPNEQQDLADKQMADVAQIAQGFSKLPADENVRRQYLQMYAPQLGAYAKTNPGLARVVTSLYQTPLDPTLNQIVTNFANHGYSQADQDKNALGLADANSNYINATHKVGPPGSVVLGPNQGNAPVAGAPAAATAPGGDAAFNSVISKTVFPNEGSKPVTDVNGFPVKFGINGKANPASVLRQYGVQSGNIADLTPDQAKQIYYDKYWKPSGAANLPANLQAPYFDVYIRSKGIAERALAQSGNDPTKFMQAADGLFQSLAARNPSRYGAVAQGWANRDARDASMATNDVSPTAPVVAAAATAPANGAGNMAGDLGPANAAPALPTPGLSSGIAQLQAQQQQAMGSWGGSAQPSTRPMTAQEIQQFAPGKVGAAGFVDAAGRPHLTAPGIDGNSLLEKQPQAAHDLAQNLVAQGIFQAPSMGFGPTGARNRVYLQSVIDSEAKAMGLTGPDAAVQRANYQGQTKALSSLTGRYSQLQATTNAITSNVGQFLKYAQQLPDTGSVSLNTIMNSGRAEFGDPRIAHAAISALTAAGESAQATIASASGAGVPTEGLVEAYRNMFNFNLPRSAQIAAAQQFLVERQNVLNGTALAIKQQQARMRGDMGHSAPAPQSSPSVNVPQGAVQYLKSNPTPQMRQYFDQKYGPGKSAQILGR